MIDQLPFLLWPFLGLLCIGAIHVYLGLHVVEREVIFVDLSLAQLAVLGAAVATLWGLDPHDPPPTSRRWGSPCSAPPCSRSRVRWSAAACPRRRSSASSTPSPPRRRC